MKQVCWICKGPFGLVRYHRELIVNGEKRLVPVCSKKCLNFKQREFGKKWKKKK